MNMAVENGCGSLEMLVEDTVLQQTREGGLAEKKEIDSLQENTLQKTTQVVVTKESSLMEDSEVRFLTEKNFDSGAIPRTPSKVRFVCKSKRRKSINKDGKQSDVKSPVKEVYRQDLISAMKISEKEVDRVLQHGFYILKDTWRAEWNAGVQVPSRDKSEMSQPVVRVVENVPNHQTLDLLDKPVGVVHSVRSMYSSYDASPLDVEWLNRFNEERKLESFSPISLKDLESAFEEFERQVFCYRKRQEHEAVVYDETSVCDVCRSPESEVDDQIVFCDLCDVGVHQMCYGVRFIPRGSWYCLPCSQGQLSPPCVLCPNRRGAMKLTTTSSANCPQFVHVSCATWISGTRLNSHFVDITDIPIGQRGKQCFYCKIAVGACIKCCAKRGCKTWFHVTCGYESGIQMFGRETEETVGMEFKSFCSRHFKKDLIALPPPPPPTDGVPVVPDQLPLQRPSPQRKEKEFHVDLETAVKNSSVDLKALRSLLHLWKLERQSCFESAMVRCPDNVEVTCGELAIPSQVKVLPECLRSYHQEKLVEAFTTRARLEQLRKLVDKVKLREVLKRQYSRIKRQIFDAKVACLESGSDGLKYVMELGASSASDVVVEEAMEIVDDSSDGERKENTLPLESEERLEKNSDGRTDEKKSEEGRGLRHPLSQKSQSPTVSHVVGAADEVMLGRVRMLPRT